VLLYASSEDLDAVHLHCHIGTDTASLARLGARMTGLDFFTPDDRPERPPHTYTLQARRPYADGP
jgi:hypothetical protein